MDLVESVMNDTFTQIKGEFTDIDQLSTIDRMKTFAKKCLKSTTAEILCQVTLDAITKYAADL